MDSLTVRLLEASNLVRAEPKFHLRSLPGIEFNALERPQFADGRYDRTELVSAKHLDDLAPVPIAGVGHGGPNRKLLVRADHVTGDVDRLVLDSGVAEPVTELE